MSIKNMLEIFMPEMDLDIFEGEIVMCSECSEALKSKKISLTSILEHKITDVNFGSVASDATNFKIGPLPDVVSDKNAKPLEEENNSDRHKNVYNYNSLKRSYACDQCEYKAYRLDLLKTHKQKHDKNMLSVKEYKCDLCMYSTLRKRALDRHLFTHKGKSKHLCDVCNKHFAEKYQLKLHAITHTGQELPHKCQECGKGYLTKSYLKQHMETRHLAKDRRICPECPQEKCEHSFTRYYKCNLCESSFSDKRGLEAHKFTHTGGELPYKCLHCNFSTAWKGRLMTLQH
ncbi:zinc finger protein 431-like [Asbolus verrucosus]|uniref:Zinc finger protein 431-like n=1 Tax=Asbolus verrucosus TaxID=1661398 RepID=A0A482VG55_ASBVE|nr:zinc finger protein 431-like [Asbolus verrucosus]